MTSKVTSPGTSPRRDRLLARRGFAVFAQDPAFSAGVLGEYLDADRAVERVVYVPHDRTDPAMSAAVVAVCSGVELVTVPFGDYGTPDNIRAVSEMPADSLCIVVADLRHMVGNRLDLRLHYLYTRHRARKKVVLDVLPYEVAPWKTFFPFGVFDKHLLAYNHSYAIEQDWDKFLDGYSDVNPCEAGKLAAKTAPATVVDRPAHFTRRPEFHVVLATPEVHSEYARYRDSLFSSEKSITAVKKKVHDWLQVRFPQRTAHHDMRRVYRPDWGRAPVIRTDLPFDSWIQRETVQIMDHTDEMLRTYHSALSDAMPSESPGGESSASESSASMGGSP